MSEPASSSVPPTDAQGDPQQSQAPDTASKSKTQQRIDQLIKTKSAAEAQAAQLTKDNTQLLNQLSTLSRQLEEVKLTAPAVRDVPGQQVAGHSSTGTVDAPRLEETIRSIVSEALRPLVEKEQQRDAGTNLARAQTDSYSQALESMPKLRDTSSEEFKVFSQIFNARQEFLNSPDGPLLATEVARGILADARRERRDSDAAKSNASAVKPRGASYRLQTPDDYEKAVQVRDSLMGELKTRVATTRDLQDYITLALATSQGKSQGE